jgi:uncharacterized protein YybS (DUF2232 family)
MRMAESKKYEIVLTLCLLHAALVGVTRWLDFGPDYNTPRFNQTFDMIWGIFLLAWPLWLIVLFMLWRSGDRKRWKLVVPIVLGLLLLIPAFFFLFVMWAFGQRGPG